jgi:hypothetical protein
MTPIHRGEQEKLQGPEGESPPETPVNGNENADGSGDGAPLDRTQSQANQLGTKQIAVIMTALCVRSSLFSREKEGDIMTDATSSWHCFWQPWIWYATLHHMTVPKGC